VINAPASSAKNFYVARVLRNGKDWSYNWLNHFDLMKGGTLNFELIPTPNKKRGISPSSFPYSMSGENK
jgi:putative alpha-1,2-mannosidase